MRWPLHFDFDVFRHKYMHTIWEVECSNHCVCMCMIGRLVKQEQFCYLKEHTSEMIYLIKSRCFILLCSVISFSETKIMKWIIQCAVTIDFTFICMHLSHANTTCDNTNTFLSISMYEQFLLPIKHLKPTKTKINNVCAFELLMTGCQLNIKVWHPNCYVWKQEGWQG